MSRTTEMFLAPWQAADYTGLTIEAMYALLERGDIPGDKVHGRWRIRKSALDAWLDAEVPPEELEQLAPHIRGLTPEQARALIEQARTP